MPTKSDLTDKEQTRYIELVRVPGMTSEKAKQAILVARHNKRIMKK